MTLPDLDDEKAVLPRLSVIVPAYNRASFLPACVSSLRNAGVAGLEIIIVDDGSKDDTRAVVESLGPDIVYVHQHNQGLPAARNAGIRASRGRYIAYLDSDDCWLPGVAEKLVGFLERHQELGAVFADALMGNSEQGFVSWFAAAGRHEFRELPARELEDGLRVLETLPFYRLMLQRNCIFTGAIVIRREVVQQHGMFNPALRSAGEDWEAWLRMMHEVSMAYWDEPLAIYTKHDAAMTNDLDFMHQGWCDALVTHRPWAERLGAADRQRWLAALRFHLFDHAYETFLRGDYATARARFSLRLREGWDLRSAMFWLACALPGPVVRRLRRVKQTLSQEATAEP